MSSAFSPLWNGAQFFDNQGKPLSGGKIFTYVAGSSTTQQSTFTTDGGTILNSNPIVLDSSGRNTISIWLNPAERYNFVLTNAAETIIDAVDGVSGVLDSAAIAELLAAFHVTYADVAGTVTWDHVTNKSGVSGLVNDAGYVTASTAPVRSVAGRTGNVVVQIGDVSGVAPLHNAAMTGSLTLNGDDVAVVGAANITDNGFITLGGGLVLAWGQTGSIAPDTEAQVTFSPAFLNRVFSVTLTPEYDGGSAYNTDNMAMVRGVSRTGFFACRSAASGSNGIAGIMYWQAIGF